MENESKKLFSPGESNQSTTTNCAAKGYNFTVMSKNDAIQTPTRDTLGHRTTHTHTRTHPVRPYIYPRKLLQNPIHNIQVVTSSRCHNLTTPCVCETGKYAGSRGTILPRLLPCSPATNMATNLARGRPLLPAVSEINQGRSVSCVAAWHHELIIADMKYVRVVPLSLRRHPMHDPV
jgi:hypothetical protein